MKGKERKAKSDVGVMHTSMSRGAVLVADKIIREAFSVNVIEVRDEPWELI